MSDSEPLNVGECDSGDAMKTTIETLPLSEHNNQIDDTLIDDKKLDIKGESESGIKEKQEPTVIDTTKQQKKKLSLQERLALAAQKKKTKNSETNLKSKKNLMNGTENNNIENKILSMDTKEPAEFSNSKQENVFTITDNKLNNENDEEFIKKLIPEEFKDQRDEIILQLKKYLSQKTSEANEKFVKQISLLEDEVNKLKKSKIASNVDELLKKLEEKENQINDLIDEGTKLSKKELSLNQTIKKIKQRESELEDDLEHQEKIADDLNVKIENLEKKLENFDEVKRSLVEEKISLETLQNKYDSLVRANDSLTDELKEIKFSKLDIQLDNSLKELEKVNKLHQETNDKYDKLNLLFKQTKEEKESIISDLEIQLKSEKLKVSDITREYGNEIKRLEDKIENLRFQNESTIQPEKSIDDIEILQIQYDQAQENWKLIESSYLKKISNFEIRIEELQNLNVIYSKKIKVLTNDLKKKSLINDELQENEINSITELEILKKKNILLLNNNKTLEENLKTLKDEFEKEKESFEKRVQNLEEEKNSLEASLKLRNNDFNSSSTALNQNSFYLQDLTSSSSLNYLKSMNTPTFSRSASSKKFSISLGESSTTPRLSNSNSNSFSLQKLNNMSLMSTHDKILRHQNSTISIDSSDAQPLGIQISNNDSTDNGRSMPSFSLDSPLALMNNNTSQDFLNLNDEIPLGMDAESGRLSTINGDINTPNIGMNSINGGVNIQLIKKMSAHVRMLELEVLTLKNETKSLEAEKEAASEEIVRLIEDNGKVEEIREIVDSKEKDIVQLQKDYERVLILLGEKEERVGELTADVQDLKDLLKQQVQQMVEMQEKINENK